MNNTDLKTLKKSISLINEGVELLLVLNHREVLLKEKSDSFTVASKQKIWQKIEVESRSSAVY